MALCTTPVYSSTLCQPYPSAYACASYLGNGSYVYKNNIRKTLSPDYDNKLREILDYFRLLLPNNSCKDYLALLICHYLYPLCIPNETNKLIWDKKQKLCREACYFLHNDLCDGKTGGLSTIMVDFSSVRYEDDQEFKDNIGNFLKSSCENNAIYDQSDNSDERDCFFKRAFSQPQLSGKCDSNGFIYNGSVATTVNNKSCDRWSNACLNHAIINYSKITQDDENYCRNPGGYRKQPWCFVNASVGTWEFCNVSKCPAIDGNYSTWSEWGECNSQCVQVRSRNCTNPAPKYFGKNCTGPSEEFRNCTDCQNPTKGNNLLLMILIPTLITSITIVFLAIVYVCFRRKIIEKRKIWEDRDILKTPEDICKFVYYMDDVIEDPTPTEEEQQYLDEILSNLKTFRECLCLNCVKKWLLSLLDESDVAAVEKKLEKMLDGLDRYQFISSGDEVKPDGHSTTCFCKEHLTDWFYERITYEKNGYSKLQRESVDDSKEIKMLQLQDGLYLLNGVPMYNLLSKKPQVSESIEDGSHEVHDANDVNSKMEDSNSESEKEPHAQLPNHSKKFENGSQQKEDESKYEDMPNDEKPLMNGVTC